MKNDKRERGDIVWGAIVLLTIAIIGAGTIVVVNRDTEREQNMEASIEKELAGIELVKINIETLLRIDKEKPILLKANEKYTNYAGDIVGIEDYYTESYLKVHYSEMSEESLERELDVYTRISEANSQKRKAIKTGLIKDILALLLISMIFFFGSCGLYEYWENKSGNFSKLK